MPECVPVCPHTMSRGPAQCGDRCWDLAVRVPGWGEKFLMVTSFLPALCWRDGEDGAAKELSFLCSLAQYMPSMCPGSPLSVRFPGSLSTLLLEKPIQICQVQLDTTGASSKGRRQQ